MFRVKPNEHKLVMEVFDENRLTRDDFLGIVEIPLAGLPREHPDVNIPRKYYILRPRRLSILFSFFKKHFELISVFFLLHSARSKVKGHLQIYHAYIPDPNEPNESAQNIPPAGEVCYSNLKMTYYFFLIWDLVQVQDPEPGWEMVESTESENNAGQAQVEQPARVSCEWDPFLNV